MRIKILSIGKDKNKILWWIILTALMVAAILIAVSIYFINSGKENPPVITKKDDIFNISSYSAKYNITVISNKTTNKYVMEEDYKKEIKNEGTEKDMESEYFKFVTSNELGDTITYLFEDNSLKITSSSEKSSYMLSDYMVKKRNIFSFSTFANIYNDVKLINLDSTKESCAKLETEEFENKTLYRLTFTPNCNCEICSNYSDLFRAGIQITRLEMVISNDTNTALEYVVYNKENKAYIDITYENFKFE